ncbi:MAG: sensor histidine kinase [Bacillota bacterium]
MKNKLLSWLLLFFLFFSFSFLLKHLLTPFSINILADLEKSIITSNNGLLIIAALKTIIYETFIDLPVFLLAYSFVYFHFKDFTLPLKFIYMSFITLALYFINLAIYEIRAEIFIFLLVLATQTALLAIYHKNQENFLSSIFVLFQIKFAFSCLLLAPGLNSYGVGYTDLVTGVKIGASYLSKNTILNFFSVAFFSPFMISGVFFTLFSILYKRRLESEKREKDKEKELLKMQMFAEEAQVWQELHFLVHDLKTPLMTTAGLNSLIEMKTDNPQVKEYCQRIDESVETVNEMISEFLHNEKRKKINVEEFIKFVRANVVVKNAYPQVFFEIKENLPSISINRIRMARALINVIENAISAVSFQDNPVISIKITTNSNNDIVITTSDNGIGIAKDNLNKIWQVNFSTKEKSHGLGMSFVKKVIEDHHGQIDVFSTEGKGTEVIIILPGVKNHEADTGN